MFFIIKKAPQSARLLTAETRFIYRAAVASGAFPSDPFLFLNSVDLLILQSQNFVHLLKKDRD
jgi:hypothetical protein